MSRRQVNLYIVPDSLPQEERVDKALALLELNGIRLSVVRLAKKFVQERGTFYDFLESLLDIELAWQEAERRQRRIKQARFPAIKTLEEFDFSYQPRIDDTQIRELASCRFIKSGENILFFGQTGVGKTHLAIALGLEAVYKGYDVIFITLDQLIDKVEKNTGDIDKTKHLFDSLMRPRLLILDEMDYSGTRQNNLISELLFRLIYQRYENKLSIIFTSNQDFVEWGKLFSNQARASAAIDRAADISRSVTISIEGPSYRMRAKQKNSKVGEQKLSLKRASSLGTA